MADIAPLGFAVDTKVLADAAAVAQEAAVRITGVADAADKVAEATDKSAEKVKKSGEAAKEAAKSHGDAAKAVTATAAAHDTLAKSAEAAGAAIAKNAETELQARQRIHDMVEKSLAQMDVATQKQQTILNLTSRVVPKNPAAMSFEKSIEQSAFNKMGPTEADLARQAKATAEAAKFTKQLQSMVSAVDPAQAKLMKLNLIVENLGKAFDAGKISRQEYNGFLDKIDAQEKALSGGPRSNRHNTFLGELGRSFTYGVPRFGREARRLIYEGENEESGGSLGAGLSGFATLAGGAAVGMLGAEAFRYVMQLPKLLGDAETEADMLQRKLSAFDAGNLTGVASLAEQLHISFKGAGEGVIAFQNAFTNLSASPSAQMAAFSAVMAGGRLSGLDEKGQTQSADQFAGIANKPLVSGSDILALQNNNPVLVNALAQQMGTTANGLNIMAQSGLVTGAALLQTAQSISQNLKAKSDQLPQTADELNTQIDNTLKEAMDHIGGGLVTWFRKSVELPFAQYLADAGTKKGTFGRDLAFALLGPGALGFFGDDGSTGGGAQTPGSSQTVKLPPAHGANTANIQDIIAKALNASAGVGGAAETRQQQQALLDTITHALSVGGNGQGTDLLRNRQRALQAQLGDTPFGNIANQVQDLTEALGAGGGSDTLIGVWQQALEIQHQQELQGLATAHSIGEIVDQLLALKRAQQAVNDEGDIRKLAESTAIASSNARLAGQGGYAQRSAALSIQQQFDREDRARLNDIGSASVPAGVGVSSTGGNLASFLAAIRFAESRGHDFDASGRPLTSKAGALYAMQVLPSTALHPGFGIAGATSNSASEYDRVGTALATALYNKFGGDAAKAAAAYHNGVGGMGRLGPQARAYIATVLRQMGISGSAGGGAVQSSLNLLPEREAAQRSDFDATEFANTAGSLASLVGDPMAFIKSGAIRGGTAGNALAQAAALKGGANEGAMHRLQLEQQITEAVKNLPPAYRDAYAQAMRLNDAAQERLKAEQQIAQLIQHATDNQVRAAAAATGSKRQSSLADLQIQIDAIKRQGLDPDTEARNIQAAKNDVASNSQLSIGGIIGQLRGQTSNLLDRQSLEQFTGGAEGDLDVETQVLQTRKAILDNSVQLSGEMVKNAQDEAEAIIRSNDALKTHLDNLDAIKGAWQFATNTIGSAWSNMFADMERHGVLHTSTLLRGIEDGFYGMLDRIYQKLVISPLMSVLDKLLNNLTNSLAGGFGGASAASSFGASGGYDAANSNLVGGLALGGVFGPRGLTPFARGGIFNAPTRFAYGGGAHGIAGEGPGLYEAIMPLRRGPDGKLGVAAPASGGNSGITQVTINDHRGASAAPVEVQERQNGDGTRSLDITLRDMQRSNVAGGRMDAEMRSSYGINRPPTRR